jgi:hypothetical protein
VGSGVWASVGQRSHEFWVRVTNFYLGLHLRHFHSFATLGRVEVIPLLQLLTMMQAKDGNNDDWLA